MTSYTERLQRLGREVSALLRNSGFDVVEVDNASVTVHSDSPEAAAHAVSDVLNEAGYKTSICWGHTLVVVDLLRTTWAKAGECANRIREDTFMAD